MRSTKMALAFALTTLIFISLGILPALQAAEFSADMETRSKGQIVTQGKIFIKGDLSRHEMSQGGHQVTLINRPDKGVVWTLMPQGKSYIEMAIDPEGEDKLPENWNLELKKEAKELGGETVNGIKCNKYELIDEGEKTTYWIAKKEGQLIRLVTPETEINYSNLHSEHQPDHLFQLPTGYRKFAMPGMENMQGMPGVGNR